MATGDTSFDNDAKAVQVSLLHSVAKNQVAYVDGFLGIAASDGESGDDIALTIDGRGYQFVVPDGLSVSKGDTVWVDVTSLDGHLPQDAAYSTTSGSDKVRLFRAMEDKDENNVVTGKLLGGLGLA